MVRSDSTDNRLVAQSREGKNLWRARLVVEDDEGRHEAAFGSEEGSAQAGPWTIVWSCTAVDSLDGLALEVHPAGERRLGSVYLEVHGGEQAVPPLDTLHTKALVYGAKAFDPDGVVPLGPEVSLRSRVLLALGKTPRTPALLWGLGGPAEDLSWFSLGEGLLRAGFEVDRSLAAPLALPLLVGSAAETLDLLDAYGKALGAHARPASPPPTGWNSWDYYAGAISMNDVRREMAALVQAGMTQQVRHVVLDMGWEQSWGEWTPNRRFPGTFREIADEITAAGFVPGIWLAPLQCHRFSPLGRHRQDLLVKATDGFPALVGEHAMLDFTQEDVLLILQHWFSEMREAGFRLFKLDYLYADYLEALAGYADRRHGRAGLIRRGLERIRQAVGEESHIVNCGGPMEAMLGIADSARATMDIHTFWGHITYNARQLASRLWQHGRLWSVDPDFAVVRSAQTSRDPYLNPAYRPRPLQAGASHWFAGAEASQAELQLWLSVVYLSAGSIFLSDSMPRLNPAGLAALAKLFPPLPAPARPLDLFINPIPRFWLGSDGRRQVLGVFNWSDETVDAAPPRTIEVPNKGTDIWTGRSVAIGPDTRMKPRSGWLLRCG